MLAIAVLALGDQPPDAVEGFGAGAAAAVVAVVVQAGLKLIDPRRGLVYVIAGALGAALAGPYVVAILVLAGFVELGRHTLQVTVWPALVWLAVKVGALSYGGGYVIIPLMYGDAVEAQRWMSAQEFANAVAYGQITPGPVTHTVALVGYAATGIGGALVATAVAFAPSFAMVMLGARALRAAAHERQRARVPRRRRARRRGRDPRRRAPARAGDRGHLAVARGGRRRGRARAARPADLHADRRRGGRGRDYALAMGLAEELQDETAEVLSALIRFRTVNPPGNERACQEWLADYLSDAGLEVEMDGAEPDRPNLVATYKAATARRSATSRTWTPCWPTPRTGAPTRGAPSSATGSCTAAAPST